jgi:SAM-dependent methyltransferase
MERQCSWVAGSRRLVGIDPSSSIRDHSLLADRAAATGEGLPFVDGSFSLVTANMVFEHLAKPREVLAEIYRVLGPGGCFLLHTPNYYYPPILIASITPERLKKWLVRTLEGRAEEDIFPTYYRANTQSAVERLFRESGFRAYKVRIEGSVGAFQLLGPIGVLEVVFLKLLSLGPLRRFDAAILAVARKAQSSPSTAVRQAGRTGLSLT